MAEGKLPRRFVDLDVNFVTEVGAASQAASHLNFVFRPTVISRWSAARPPEVAVGERARREQARSRLRAIVRFLPVLVLRTLPHRSARGQPSNRISYVLKVERLYGDADVCCVKSSIMEHVCYS